LFIKLLYKEFTLELRRKSVISGLVLYLFSTAFICYLSFSLRQNLITPLVWSALFWITILFTAINTIAKSFIGEKRGLTIYEYSIANPTHIILSKIAYNFILSSFLSITGLILFVLFLGNPIADISLFLMVIFVTSFGFAASLTLLSGIAAKANSSVSWDEILILLAINCLVTATSYLLFPYIWRS
jgi:heme exporter protein B